MSTIMELYLPWRYSLWPYLTKDDFDAIMELELLCGAGAKASVAGLPSAVKSTLTRKYNQALHHSHSK